MTELTKTPEAPERDWSVWACKLFGGPDVIAKCAADRINHAVAQQMREHDPKVIIVSDCLALPYRQMTASDVRAMTRSDFLEIISPFGLCINLSDVFPSVNIPQDQWQEWERECIADGIEVLSVLDEDSDLDAANSILLKISLHLAALEEVCLPNRKVSVEYAARINELRKKYRAKELPHSDL